MARSVGSCISIVLAISLIFTAVGCTTADNPSSSGVETDTSANGVQRLKVASTVSPITSLAENVGGDRIELVGIVPEGTNSHTFEPAPSVAAVLADSDLFIANGLFLEEPTIRMAKSNLRDGASMLILGPMTVSEEDWVFDFSFPEDEGHPNPHLWTAPHLALKYAEHIRDELVRLDADNAPYYQENFDALKVNINELDRRIMEAVETVPPENRLLLTYHDSFPYFRPQVWVRDYRSHPAFRFHRTFRSREVASLIDQVRDNNVPAIFGSEVFPSPVLEQIAREGGAEFVDQLRDDDLPGGPGDPEHTYMGLILEDVRIITTALGGDPSALEGYDPSNVFEGESGAVYPQ